MKTLLILRHSPLDGPGSLEPYFRNAGWQIDTVEAAHADLTTLDPLAADLVLPLGSALSVYDEALFPFITAERALLAQRMEADRPVLGICFGAQLIASALGCRVYPALQSEIGWFPLALTDAGRASPLSALDPAQTPAVMHWHQDTFDLPPDTQHLARSALCENQAFARGTNLLALQFHPEVTRNGVEAWLADASFTPETRAERIASIRQGAAQHQATMQTQIAHCLDAWLAGLV